MAADVEQLQGAPLVMHRCVKVPVLVCLAWCRVSLALAWQNSSAIAEYMEYRHRHRHRHTAINKWCLVDSFAMHACAGVCSLGAAGGSTNARPPGQW